METFAGLPGAEFVAAGLQDLERGVVSVPALPPASGTSCARSVVRRDARRVST